MRIVRDRSSKSTRHTLFAGSVLGKSLLWIGVGLALLGFSTDSDAVDLADYDLYASMGDSTLVLVDTSSASLQSLNSLDHSLRCLTYDPHTGTIYGISHQYGPRLVTIDPVTGEASLVDTLRLAGGGNVYTSEAIAFNPADSLLYCSCSLNGVDAGSEALALIDPVTAEVTPIGTFSGTVANDGDAMVFIDDTLYVIDDPGAGPSYFYLVDHQTNPGQASQVGILLDPRFNNVNDLTFQPDSRVLYGFAPHQRLLITIDWHTGTGTVVGVTHTIADFHGSTMWAITVGPAGIGTAVAGPSAIPGPALTELRNAPNPFNPMTEIGYTLAVAGPAVLTVHDAAGRLVVTLVNTHKSAGSHAARWNGKDATGAEAASGVYFARLKAEGKVLSRKITLIR